MTEEERTAVEWLIAESQWVIQLGEQHKMKLGQLQAILAWEDRNESVSKEGDE